MRLKLGTWGAFTATTWDDQYLTQWQSMEWAVKPVKRWTGSAWVTTNF